MARLARLIPILCAVFALAPSAAQACLPMPPPPIAPGETEAAYADRVAKAQAALAKFENDAFDKRVRGYWDAAGKVVLARVDRSTPRDDGGFRLRLTGVQWLKGAKGGKTFDLTTSPPPPCVPIDQAATGDMVVLYVPAAPSKAKPFWIRPKAIRDPRVTALLPKE